MRLYVFGILDNFWLARAVWVLFLLQRGFTLAEITLGEALLHLTVVALQLPVGRLADRIGRKYTLAFGCLCAIAAGTLYLYAPSIALLMLAFVFDGIASTCRSGSQEALFYDTCQSMGRHRDYPRLYGQFAAATMLSLLIAETIGGTVSEWSFPAVYGVQMGAAALALVAILGAREPDHRAVNVSEGFDPGSTMAAIRLVMGRPRLRVLFAFQAVFWTMVNLMVLYGQHLFAEQGAARSTIGLVYGIASFVGIISAYRSYVWERWIGERRSLIGSLLLAVLGVVMVALLPAPYCYLGFFVFYLASEYMEPVFSDYVNREIPSHSRATTLSFFSLAMSLLTAMLLPMIGALSDQVAVGHLLASVAIGGAIALLPGLWAWREVLTVDATEGSSVSSG